MYPSFSVPGVFIFLTRFLHANRYPLRSKTLRTRLLVQLIGEMRLHRRPFAGDDAVDHGVAQRPVGRDLMAAQDAVLLGAQPLDAAPALMIEEMGAEFDRDAVEFFERVAEQQQFALGIEPAALHAPGVPGRADLDPPDLVSRL